jgi:hypothetical protein
MPLRNFKIPQRQFLVIVFVIKKTPFFLFFTAIVAVVPVVDILAPCPAITVFVCIFILTGLIV